MFSRWHHIAGNHYEIDSIGWAWTWVSPDIWVDNDGNGLADNDIFFNYNNKLFIRLRNQGRANASNIGVNFWYQDASGGLSDAAWLPVKNKSGVTQSLTNLNLAAGATNQWSVDWSPAPSGTSKHFCVRAVVTVPGDPNTDNKRCLSNFGNVIMGSPYADLSFLRRLPAQYKDFRFLVIPRTDGRVFVSNADLELIRKSTVRPGQKIMDTFRIRRRAKITHNGSPAKLTADFLAKKPCPKLMGKTRLELEPDPFGHYPTNPRALPPGLEGVPLITVAHVVDGRLIGGFTWAIREKKQKR